jgi:hypothetical protein
VEDDFVKVVERGQMLPDVGGGLRGPAYYDVVARIPEHPDVEISAHIEPLKGTYGATKLTFRSSQTGQAIPAEALGQLPLRTLVRATVAANLRSLNIGQVIAPAEGEDRSPEAGELRNVAQLYRISRLVGDAPTQAVQRVLRVSRATAVRRVRAARNAGFLGPDEIGQAGSPRSRLER